MLSWRIYNIIVDMKSSQKDRECSQCHQLGKYYAKGLCSVCYQRNFRSQQKKLKLEKLKPIVSLPDEEWLDVVGYEGLYAVSSKGRVKSITREIRYPNGEKHIYYERLLKPCKDKDGYQSVSLSKDGDMKGYRLHRLVLEAFVGEAPKGKDLVNHKNGVKDDNRVENLEWCDANENQQHRIYVLKKKAYFGIKPVECIENGKIFPSVRKAASWAGIPHSNLSVVLHGSSIHHTAGGYHWRFVNNNGE